MRLSNQINEEIERLKSELEDLTDTGVAIKNKATDTLIEQTEARPLTTLAAMAGRPASPAAPPPRGGKP